MRFPAFVKKLLDHSFLKFLLIGGVNTVFGYLVFSAIIFLLKNIYISVVLANIIAILFNFKTYGGIVFKSKDNSRIYRFFGVYLVVIAVQLISLKTLAYFGIPNPYVEAAIITLPVAVLSFFLMRKFVFTMLPANKN